MIFKQLILICAASVPHERCDESTAVDVLSARTEAATVAMCERDGMVWLANLHEIVGPDYYGVIRCTEVRP